MKRPRLILFRIFFFLLVLSCVGLNADLLVSFHQAGTEFSAGAINASDTMIPDIDSSEDDQIGQTNELSSFTEPGNQPSNPKIGGLPACFTSIWLPPQNS